MKKYAMLVLASLLIFSMSAMAQEKTTPSAKTGVQNEVKQGPRKQISAQMRAENMAKDLSLTDVEKAKVQEVFEKNDVIFTKFRTEVTRESSDFREKFKALRDAQNEDLLKVIGKDKFQTWQTMMADRRQKNNKQ